MAQGYSEPELVANRTAVLLWGGTEEDRRMWAEETATRFHADGPLRIVAASPELVAALQQSRGVVYVPNAASLNDDAQLALVRCLREREERPKIVVSFQGGRQTAVDKGLLRPDLDYALSLGRVDLDASGVREGIKSRRADAARAAKARVGKHGPTKSARTQPHAAKRARPVKKSKAKRRR